MVKTVHILKFTHFLLTSSAANVSINWLANNALRAELTNDNALYSVRLCCLPLHGVSKLPLNSERRTEYFTFFFQTVILVNTAKTVNMNTRPLIS
jgi:hypothetical protein